MQSTAAIIYLDRLSPSGSSDSTRKVPRAASSLPYSVLLRVGFTKPADYSDAGALLPHLSTLTPPKRRGGFLFYGTFPKVALAGRYPAHCPVEPGLSSCGSYVRQRLPFMLAKVIIQTSLQSVKLQRISKKSRAAASATISTLSPNSSANRFAKISTTGCSVAKCPASTTWIPSAAARCAS